LGLGKAAAKRKRVAMVEQLFYKSSLGMDGRHEVSKETQKVRWRRSGFAVEKRANFFSLGLVW
jgi:hypothetical protein